MNRIWIAIGVVSAFGAALAGCGGHALPTSNAPHVTVMAGAPLQANPAPQRNPATGVESPTVVSSVEGAVAAGTPGGVFVGLKSGDALHAMTVVSTGSDPLTTGAVTFIARRGNGGALIQAQNGLFHDLTGYLLFSPLTASVTSMSPTTLDAFGTEPSEDLWFSSAQGALYVGGGQVQTYDVTGQSGAPEAVVAAGPGQAVIAWNGSAYLLDLNKNTLTLVGENLGKVNGFDHGDDGTVYLATASGLFSYARSGTATLYTFTASGQPAAEVLAVGAAYGTVLAVTRTQLIDVSGSSSSALTSLTQGAPGRSVAVDTNGDGWVIDQGQLAHVLTGKPVSYAMDVKPFFDAHCTTCHYTAGGGTANGAPSINFDDYATAQSIAPVAVKRLEADGYSPMPPPTANDPLTPKQYGVVIRWVGGGYQP